MAEGWILLYRKIQDCDIWANNQPFDMRSAWIDLLLLANHRNTKTVFDYKSITIKRGQYLTSVRKLSERWSWSKNRTLKYLRMLEKLGMIERESNNQRTLITLVKYGDYQCDEDTGRYTDIDTTVDAVIDASMPQTNNVKNEKNVKNNKNNNRAFQKPTVDEVRAYCQERNNGIDPVQFVDYYESKGWMIGKNKMKDWKAAVRTWENRRKTDGSGSTGNSGTDEEQRNAEIDRYLASDEYKQLVGTTADMPFV